MDTTFGDAAHGATVSIADDGAGAPAQLMALNHGVMQVPHIPQPRSGSPPDLASISGFCPGCLPTSPGTSDAGAADGRACASIRASQLFAMSLRPGCEEAAPRGLLREHLLPHFEAAGWRLLAPLEALWASELPEASVLGGAEALRAAAAVQVAMLDANSAAVLQEIVRLSAAACILHVHAAVHMCTCALAHAACAHHRRMSRTHVQVRRASATPANDDGDEEGSIQLALLPNPLGTPAGGGGDDGSPSGCPAEGPATGAGRDSSKRVYASVEEVWNELDGGHGNAACASSVQKVADGDQSGWYEVSSQYWENVSADVPGMLGGLAELHAADAAASLALIDQLRSPADAPLPDGIALDCGAGIGRVSGSVLLERFTYVSRPTAPKPSPCRAHGYFNAWQHLHAPTVLVCGASLHAG